MAQRIPTAADQAVTDCLDANQSFALIAGAGSGKTTSLVDALAHIRSQRGPELRQNSQRVACITYTNRAVEVIRGRLGFDELYQVSTLHSFLWGEVLRFQKDIREAVQDHRIPSLIAKAREDDNGGGSQKAIKARAKVARLEADLAELDAVSAFVYDDVAFSNYSTGQLSHDDIVDIAGFLLANRPNFRRLIGYRYPFVFVDEAQDTFEPIVAGLNQTCANDGLPLIGYFGDPWQQIYEGRAGDFQPPAGGTTITKTENFRSAPEVVEFLNSFRTDVQQVASGEASQLAGSVAIRLVQAEPPEGPRRRYTDDQLRRALIAYDQALASWGWNDRDDVIQLFLVRQMIARRLGFEHLNRLFTGNLASQPAQEQYEAGEHYLLKPVIQTIGPLVEAHQNQDQRQVIDTLRARSPFYSITGPNAGRSLKEMIDQSQTHLDRLVGLWQAGTIKQVFEFCLQNDLIKASDRLRSQIRRAPRDIEFDEAIHAEEKGDWLADAFFEMPTGELIAYIDFILQNTPYSTQHGVKGEEFPDVVVVYDDVEAGWYNYNFTRLLTPQTAGEPTDGQRERGRKLAYVSFSRARENLKVLLFTTDPNACKNELIERGLFDESQISIQVPDT